MSAIRPHPVLHGLVEILETPAPDARRLILGNIGGIEHTKGRAELHTARQGFAAIGGVAGSAVTGFGEIAPFFHRSVVAADGPGRLPILGQQGHGKEHTDDENRQYDRNRVSVCFDQRHCYPLVFDRPTLIVPTACPLPGLRLLYPCSGINRRLSGFHENTGN